MNYLNKTGLQYFWTKIKSAFLSTQGGSIYGNLNMIGNINENENEMHSIGSSSKRFASIYAKNVYADNVEGKVVYENESGTNSTIDIEENIFNNKEMKVEYKINYNNQDEFRDSKTVPLVASGQKNNILSTYLGSVYCYFYATQLTITNNQITFYGNRVLTLGNNNFSIDNASPIKITKITVY